MRGWNIHELLNTSQRITSPLIKKDKEFQKASYSDAIAFAIEKLNAFKANPDSIGFLASPRSSNEESYLLMKLARSVYKTGNISLDSESGHRNSLNVLYEGTGMAGMLGSLDEIRKAEFILLVGIDITKQNPIIGSEIHMAALNGSHVVTVDSRKTQMARLSRDFFQIKPGSKKSFLAGMAKSLVDGNLQDQAFISANTEGVEKFTDALKSVTEDKVTADTGIHYADIKKTAAALAGAKTAMVFFSSGISGLDEETIRYIYDLFLLAGKIGKEGCGVNPVAGLNNLQGGYDMGLAPDLLTGFQPLSDASVVKKFNSAWGGEMGASAGKPIYDYLSGKEKGLKALIVADHDEGIIRYAEEIEKLDFVLYIGTFQNAFTKYADVVLPIASYVETDGTYTNTERRVQLSEKKIDPAQGMEPGWKVISMLAEKAGAKWSYGSPSDIMAEIAKLTPAYAGITYDKLKKFGLQWPVDDKNPEGTRHFDLAKAGRKLRFLGVSGALEAARAEGEYNCLLMVGKAQHYWHQNNLMMKTYIPLREYNATLLDYPEGYVEISQEDAKELKVRDRFPVKVISSSGSMQVAVKVSDEVKSGTAYAPYFVQDMITKFLLGHTEILKQGEDATIPVRIEKV